MPFADLLKDFKLVFLIDHLGEFWIRLRVIGKCESRQLEQFAVLSYAPVSVTTRSLSFPRRRFPDYSEKFGNGKVSLI